MIQENFVYYAVSAMVIGFVSGVLLSGTCGGIVMTLFMLGYECFLYVSVKRQNGMMWPKSRHYLLYSGLLSVTLSITNNRVMLIVSLMGILILLTLFLYHQFNTDENWGFSKVFAKLLASVLVPVVSIFRIFADIMEYRKEQKINMIYLHIGAGILIAIPAVGIMAAILMSADDLFQKVMESLFGWISFDIDFGKLVLFVIITCLAYSFFVFMMSGHEEGTEPRRVKHQPVTAIIVYGVLTAMYALFCVVQLGYLFVWKDSSTYVYAGSAREGFFQLTFVGIINLILVVNGISHLQKTKVLDRIMLIMSVCTYGMMISAAVKMFLYVKAYHLTVLRFMVSWAIVVIAVVFFGVIRNIYDENMQLFSYAKHVFCICFLLLAFARPDYVVAQYNLNMAKDYTDFNYLRKNLSIDIVPVVVSVKERYDGNEEYERLLKSLEKQVNIEKTDKFVLGGLAELAGEHVLN